jgi:hypothetical protein
MHTTKIREPDVSRTEQREDGFVKCFGRKTEEEKKDLKIIKNNTMVNKIDKNEFRFIEVAFFKKTDLRHVSLMDIDGKESLKHLQNIIDSDKPMLKTLCLEHDEIERSYRNVTNVVSNNKKILEYHFVWARMILEFYYFYHETKDEAQKIVDKMLALEGFVYIKEAVQEGLKLIDEYYEAEWNENIPDRPRSQKQQDLISQLREETIRLFAEENDAQQQSKPIQNPNILQLMQDINSGKVRYQNVDWGFQLNHLLQLCQVMPKRFPSVILIWGILSIIDDPTIKMDIIGQLQEAAPKCIKSRSEARDFIDDSACIYRVCMQVRAFNLRNDIEDKHVWTDDRKDLNDLAHILSDEMVDAKWMVGMVEEMKRSESENRRHPMLEIILKSNRNIGQLSVDNIVDFAKKLYIAEGFRQLILSGQEDYRDIPVLKDFQPKLLKACFEEYIRLRSEHIKEIIERDLTHYGDAEEMECLEKLQETENQLINRENGLEAFQGSPAYNAMWYPGRQKVLEMINVFSQYLQNKINKQKKAEKDKQSGAKTMNFYAPVENVIANVENFNNTKE